MFLLTHSDPSVVLKRRPRERIITEDPVHISAIFYSPPPIMLRFSDIHSLRGV